MGVDWESQLKPKESTPVQDVLEENSFHDMQMDLKVAVEIQRVAMLEPSLSFFAPWMTRSSGLPAQDPAWLQQENTEEATVVPKVLTTCLQDGPWLIWYGCAF